jgi:lipopolysaccharide/colanic/teichoic acid biosynthesis glycosyltransferase
MTRRLIDLLVAVITLITLTPLLALLSLLVWASSGRPIFFIQSRAGLNGVPFRMIKFRTMCRNAEKTGGSLTFKADLRITPVGRFLRRWKLDELPQLLNVLVGEMTIIGPRPEVLDWIERYTAEQREILRAKPGLSDPVQILFRHEQDFLGSASEYEKLFAIKVRKQIECLRCRTPLSDIVTAFRALRALFPSKASEDELAIYAQIRSTTDSEGTGKSGSAVSVKNSEA